MNMQRRQSLRRDVDSNVTVLLSTRKDTARAYKVVNFSNEGLLLTQPAKTVSIPKDIEGDTVELAFNAGSLKDRQSYRLAANVTRTTESEIALSLNEPGSGAAEQLKSMLASGSAPVESVDERQEPELPAGGGGALRSPWRPGSPSSQSQSNGTWKLAAAVAGIIAVAFVGVLFYLSDTRNRLATIEELVVSLEQDRNTEGNDIAGLQEDVERLTGALSDVSSLRTGNEELQQAIAVLSETTVELSQRIDALGQAPNETTADKAPAPAPESSDAQWVVNLVSLSDPNSVERMKQRLAELGIKVNDELIGDASQPMHRLAVPGFTSYEEAKAFSIQIKKELNLEKDPWISKI